MIDCIFTLDYEIYGNGTGTLRELVYEPAQELAGIFRRWNARFVNFVEVVELQKIDSCHADPYIEQVARQVRELYEDGFEVGLHLHPQWANAQYEKGKWNLDFSEYNLCTLPRTRIQQIVEKSLSYLRHLVGQSDFVPLSFRAGNWLFQPTNQAAAVLGENGIRVDSSVFKGGVQRNHGLDYRPALRNGYYWFFDEDVNDSRPRGRWMELPIYTEMVPAWQVPTSKRLGFRGGFGLARATAKQKINRVRDFLRYRYPIKFDFCRMTLKELTSAVTGVIAQDREDPGTYRPIVAIGHTKDLCDAATVDRQSERFADGCTFDTGGPRDGVGLHDLRGRAVGRCESALRRLDIAYRHAKAEFDPALTQHLHRELGEARFHLEHDPISDVGEDELHADFATPRVATQGVTGEVL